MLKAVHHVLASRTETKHGQPAVNLRSTCGQPAVNLHRLTLEQRRWVQPPAAAARVLVHSDRQRRKLDLKAKFESGSSYL